MNKDLISKIMFILSIVLVVCFIIVVIIDYSNYNSLYNSAPFTTFLLAHVFTYLLPSIILAVIGFILRKKANENNK